MKNGVIVFFKFFFTSGLFYVFSVLSTRSVHVAGGSQECEFRCGFYVLWLWGIYGVRFNFCVSPPGMTA